MTFLGKMLFILSSYTPLFVLLGLRFSAVDPIKAPWAETLSTAFYGIAALSFFGFILLVSLIKSANSISPVIKSYGRKDDQILSYTITYFPPLLSIELSNSIDLWSLLIIYTVLIIVYIRLNAYYINPFFALWGYRIYEVVSTEGKTYAALVKRGVLVQEGDSLKGPAWDEIIFISGK